MIVVSEQDCFFSKGLRRAGVPFEFDGNVDDYPFLSKWGSAGEKAVPTSEARTFDEGAAGQQQRDMALLSVLDSLDADNDELWTVAGTPRVSAVEELVGFDTSNAEIKLLRPDLTRRG